MNEKMNRMDYYNAFVIHSMMVDMTAIMLEKQMGLDLYPMNDHILNEIQ